MKQHSLECEFGDLMMRYIRFKELRGLIPLGRTTIWRMMREGRFPQSRRIGKMAAAWLESEVEDWIRQRAEEGANSRVFGNRRQYEQI
jgi:prophage regulatory protein